MIICLPLVLTVQALSAEQPHDGARNDAEAANATGNVCSRLCGSFRNRVGRHSSSVRQRYLF